MSYKKSRELIEYIPYFLRDLEEYKVLFSNQDVSFNNFSNSLQFVENNSFIFTMGESVIIKYEELFNIRVLPSYTINDRRINLYNMINSYPPFTRKWFVFKFDSILGNENYDYYFSVKEKVLEISIYEIAKSYIENIYNFLEIYLPLNFDFTMKLILNSNYTDLRVGAGLYKEVNKTYRLVG